jgi:hypothetical protein
MWGAPKMGERAAEGRRVAIPGPAAAPAALQTTRPPDKGAPLHFFRCGDCFGTLALETGRSDAVCDCGGQLEYLGRAKHERLVIDGLTVPCDARCISARGPKCECGCGGANHGSNALVAVERDAGGIPRATPRGDRATRHAIADLFRARMAKAKASYRAKVGDGCSYDPAAWQIREQLKNARRFKTQKRRLAAIDAAEALLSTYRKGNQ